MTGGHRLSICYLVPGHNLLTSAGPTRNVLYLAEALGREADVTVAFRRVLEPVEPRGYEVLEIEPGGPGAPAAVDDAAVRGTGFADFAAYLRVLRRFVDARSPEFDIVLEKSWLLSGWVTAMCGRRGVPGVVVENIVRVWNGPVRGGADLARWARHQLVQRLVGGWLRRAPLIIAETEELKGAMARRWRVAPDRIEVIGLGVNTALFRPLDQAEARRRLEVPGGATVLLYAGTLDRTHDLAPLLQAARETAPPGVEIHVVGDGELRAAYEARAAGGCARVVFHGRVPHADLPWYIAAADLCLAPYDPAAFPGGQVAYSTLKIPEYLACARPVASVPSGHVLDLIRDGVSGFLLPNDPSQWSAFLRSCPSRERLGRMGQAAARLLPTPAWDEVARAYMSVCQRVADGRVGMGGSDGDA